MQIILVSFRREFQVVHPDIKKLQYEIRLKINLEEAWFISTVESNNKLEVKRLSQFRSGC